MKITIAGVGYVGLSLAVLLSTTNKVNIIDITSSIIDKIMVDFKQLQKKNIQELIPIQLQLLEVMENQQ